MKRVLSIFFVFRFIAFDLFRYYWEQDSIVNYCISFSFGLYSSIAYITITYSQVVLIAGPYYYLSSFVDDIRHQFLSDANMTEFKMKKELITVVKFQVQIHK